MTEQLFQRLQVCHDICPHSAPINMSIDEALLETARIPTIRFFRWRSPALSFGYFGKFSDVEIYATDRDLVRVGPAAESFFTETISPTRL